MTAAGVAGQTRGLVDHRPRGFVEIQDRGNDLVKSGREWISSSELKSTLAAHLGVAEAAVIAIATSAGSSAPRRSWFLSDDSVTTNDLRAHLAARVAKWWVPHRFEIVPSLPKTSVGKLDKVDLRNQFAEQPATESHRRWARRPREITGASTPNEASRVTATRLAATAASVSRRRPIAATTCAPIPSR